MWWSLLFKKKAKMNNWTLFYLFTVLVVYFVWGFSLLFSNSHVFKTRIVFANPALFLRTPQFCDLWEWILWVEVIKLNVFMFLYAPGKEIHVMQDFILSCYFIHTHPYWHVLDSIFIYKAPGITATLQHLKLHLAPDIIRVCRVIPYLTYTLALPIHKCQNLQQEYQHRFTENVPKPFRN